jgi:hypothetical protein
MAIEVATFNGVQAGMNVETPANELEDNEAIHIQDAFVHIPGYLARRGPVDVRNASAILAANARVLAVVHTTTPENVRRVALLYQVPSAGLHLGALNDTLDGLTLAVHNVAITPPTLMIPSWSPAIGGGVLIGASEQYLNNTNNQVIMQWHGARLANFNATLTATAGSKTVTNTGAANWLTTVESGMYVTGSAGHIGTVKSVDSNTQVTLVRPSLSTHAGAGALVVATVEWKRRYGGGFITVASGQTKVVGSRTRWKTNQIPAGALLFKVDGTYLGQTSTIDSDYDLTLGAATAVAMDNEPYFLAWGSASTLTGTITNNAEQKPGFFISMYAGRQWFANRGAAVGAGVHTPSTQRVWFSSLEHHEDIDFSPLDGSWFDLPSNSPVTGMKAAHNSLVVFTEDETYALLGQSPDTFELQKVDDVGCIAGNAAIGWNGGVIWPSRQGVHFWDGSTVNSITREKMGRMWEVAFSQFNHGPARIWAVMFGDFYVLSTVDATFGMGVTKGGSTTVPSVWTFVIHMPTGAITRFSNLYLTAGTDIPGSTQTPHLGAIYASDNNAYIINTTSLWNASSGGLDEKNAPSSSQGPDFWVETKHYGLGDDVRRKLFKQIGVQYLSPSTLTMDTVVGLNTTGVTSLSTLPASASSFQAKRIKFLKRGTQLGFRLYQSTLTSGPLYVGPWQIGYKWQRAGRVS